MKWLAVPIGQLGPFLSGLCMHLNGLMAEEAQKSDVVCAGRRRLWPPIFTGLRLRLRRPPPSPPEALHSPVRHQMRRCPVGIVVPGRRRILESKEACFARWARRYVTPASQRHTMVGLGTDLLRLCGGVGCEVDDEALDELRKHAQVSIGDEWVYV
jgi:hypothetical protein